MTVSAQDTAAINATGAQTVKGWGCYPSYFTSAVPNNASDIFDKPAIQDAIYGLGITHIRVNIDPSLYTSGTTVSNMVLNQSSLNDLVRQIQIARNHGVTNYITSVWSPPSAWKDNKSINGGHLVGADEPYFVAYYIKVLQALQAAGVGLPQGISIQNEPDMSTSYDSCIYTDSGTGYALWRQLVQDMHAALVANNMSSVIVFGPECASTDNDIALLGANPNFGMMTNTTFSASLGAYASHGYGENIWLGLRSGMRTYPRDAWITEWSVDSNTADGGTENGWTVDTMSHLASNFVDVPFNYWTWWAAWNSGSTPQGTTLIAGTQTPVYSERYYVLQKLWTTVRPGWVVHSMTCSDANYITINTKQNTYNTHVDLVSFWNPTSDACVTLLVNQTATATTTAVSGLVGTKFAAYQSDATHNMAQVGSGAVSRGAATVTLAPTSVTLLITSSAAPTALSGVVAQPANPGVTLTWPISYGASGYNIKRATTSAGPFTTIGSTTTALTYSDSTAAAGSTYSYVVTALNPSGESPASNVATILLPGMRPSVADSYVQNGTTANTNYGTTTDMIVKLGPTGYTREDFLRFDVSGLANAQSVQVWLVPDVVGTTVYGENPFVYEWLSNDTWTESGITWNDKPAGSGINFANSNTGYFLGQTVVVDVTAKAKAQASVDGLLSMHIYSTLNETDGQAFVQFASKENATPSYRPVLVYILVPPSAPAGLLATAGNGQVSLSWPASANAATYNLLRSTTSGSGYVSVASGLSATSSVDTSVANGTPYFYVVEAANSGGTSANSNEVSATPVTPYQQWKSAYGFSALADTATPDGDGVAILTKFATAMIPGTPSAYGPATLSSVNNKLTLQFTRLSPAPASYVVEASTDLTNPTWATITSLASGGDTWTGAATVSETTGSTRSVTVTDVVPIGTGQRYLRLRVVGVNGTVAQGYFTVTVPGASTSTVSIPLDSPPVVRGSVQAVTSTTATVASAGNWANAATPFAVRMISGNASGAVFRISAVNGNVLTLTTSGADLTKMISVGDIYTVFSLDTLGSLFGTNSGVPFQTGATSATADGIYTWNGTGWTTYFNNGSNWMQSASLLPQNNALVTPDTGLLVVRQAANPLTLTFLGRAHETAPRQFTNPGNSTLLALPHPTTITLGATGFSSAAGWLSGPSAASADIVYVWSGSAWLAFYYNGTAWSQSGSLLNQNNYALTAGQAVFVSRHSAPASNLSFILQPLPYTP